MRFFVTVLFLISSFCSWGESMKDLSHKEKVRFFYEKLNKDSMHLVDEFYDPQIDFIDPIHSLKGSDKMKEYYSNLYKNAENVQFEFKDFVQSEEKVVAVWKMTLKTDKLNGGEPYSVEGNSVIHFGPSGKAIYHRDYFDLGAFVYEKIPVVGYVVKKIKNRMKEESQ